MIELRKCFKAKGVTFEQLLKNNTLCLYQLSKTYPNGHTSVWYELFRYRTKPADKFHQDEWEWYPGDESFGVWAWCCSNKKSVSKIVNRKFPGVTLPVEFDLSVTV